MGKVNFLPEEVISKIAGGEVIESPASVLKELIENSIDANSKKIEIKIENSGKKLIYVKDDGEGIEADDIEKIFGRYSTSKIRTKEDLYNIRTLGFRGEALYSIGAVADVILKSKTKNSDIGKEIHIRGGKKLSIKECAMHDGTILEVRELFFNIPARRKFLKSDITEFRKVFNIFIQYAIGFPEINFIFENENKTILNLIPSENYLKRFCEILNLNEDYLIYRQKKIENIDLEIIIGDINLKRPQKNMQFIFVNRRPVYNYILSSAINNFYQSFFSSEFFPVFAVYLQIANQNIDVNIHPTKREVKIKDEDRIAKKIIDIINEILKEGKIKKIEAERKYLGQKEKVRINEKIKEENNLIFQTKKTEEKEIYELFKEEKIKVILREKLKRSCFIGVFKSKYLIFESDDSLLIVDQHAVMERINYEIFINQIEKGKIQIQQILTPIIIELNYEEMIIWEKTAKILERFGFLTTRWSENKIAIHGYPSLIKDIEFAIRNILDEKDIKKYDKEEVSKRACRVSIMAGEKITDKEAKYLIEKLAKCKNPFVCPHGRPIIIELTENFLDRQFLR
ncbi:MAG: DNA mismatch repair endonuclease MutL [Candidatus Omnitrophica bacterium]|nr:DNA mismatch repair endonuclease MutL [Candidatus Omnitrophota bacterium]MCM8801720.1 DNA mismatch repair endonuclease MutL [Candidatus Omnitrophota bacterium]